MTKFELSREQAQAILDLRLQRLTAMEADKIQAEYDDLIEMIKELRDLLGDEAKIYAVIREELLEVRESHADERRTKILDQEGDIPLEDLIADRQMVISITNSGYIKSLPLDTYRSQKRGGVGIKGMDTKEDDYIEHLFVTSTHDYLLVVLLAGALWWSRDRSRPKSADLPALGAPIGWDAPASGPKPSFEAAEPAPVVSPQGAAKPPLAAKPKPAASAASRPKPATAPAATSKPTPELPPY